MNESLADYFANIIASALLAKNNQTDNNILREEHSKVLRKFIED